MSSKVDAIKETLDNEEQKIGAEIFKRALAYPIRQISQNAGVNGNVIIEKILSTDNVSYGYNAAKGKYEDLMAAGILDPAKVKLKKTALLIQTFYIARIQQNMKKTLIVFLSVCESHEYISYIIQ
nr:chaperonin 60 subunit beta 4, chloroplastic [Ipomoea batatas]